MMLAHCVECGADTYVADDLDGVKLSCPRCGAPIHAVPSLGPTALEHTDPAPARSNMSAAHGGSVAGISPAASTAHSMASGKAVASLIFGICSFLFGPLGIAGAILGFVARTDIDHSDGTLRGEGMAIWGTFLSLVGGGLWLVAWLVRVMPH